MDDFKDGKRYLDFAYIRPGFRICIEIDGYGPHLKNSSRWQFSDSLERQNQLVIDGWTVLRFSYDQVKEKPRRCQQFVPKEVASNLNFGDKKARKVLAQLVAKKMLIPASGNKRVRSYRLGVHVMKQPLQ